MGEVDATSVWWEDLYAIVTDAYSGVDQLLVVIKRACKLLKADVACTSGAQFLMMAALDQNAQMFDDESLSSVT